MSAENTRICPACATVVPVAFPPGLCPRCLLAAAGDGEADHATRRAQPGATPPLETLDALFAEL